MITPTARILLDMTDDVAVYRALERYAAEPGRLAVAPTPGTNSRTALCEDFRTAMGLPFGGRPGTRLLPELLCELRRRAVNELCVLRANHLATRTWGLLAEIAAQVPMALSMVVHQFAVYPYWRRAIEATCRLAGDVEVLAVDGNRLAFMTPAQWWAVRMAPR